MLSKKIIVAAAIAGGLLTSAGLGYAATQTNQNQTQITDQQEIGHRGGGKHGGMTAEMITAIENNDYTTWKSLVDAAGLNGPMEQAINESNFSRFAEMHKLMKEGKIDEANVIRESLGLPEPRGGRGGEMGEGKKGGMTTEMLTAIENNDYTTWRSLMDADGRNGLISQKINESNFSRFVEMHNLMKQADAIRTELGITKQMKNGQPPIDNQTDTDTTSDQA